MDVNWWVIMVPSIVTGAVTTIGMTWSNLVAQRNNRSDAELRKFHMMNFDNESDDYRIDQGTWAQD